MTQAPQKPSALSRYFTGKLENTVFHGTRFGSITVTLPNGMVLHKDGSEPGEHVRVHFKTWGALMRYGVGGELAFAEAFMDQEVDVDDLGALFDWYVKNDKQERGTGFLAAFMKWRDRSTHLRKNDNSQKKARRNIAYHYDIGNAFYSQWLDKTMTYSSALFADNESLEDAQAAKYSRIAKAAGVHDDARVLEIGCGWGGFAEHLSENSLAHYKGITISNEQLAYARDRIARQSNSADLAFEDYRETTGTFDSIVSIEMFEAVGEKYWPTYFAKVRDLLAEDGRAGIQTITIEDARFNSYRGNVDFIQKYIFPGGMLPSPAVFREQAEKAGLKVVDQFDFGQSYARTLAAWRDRFKAKWAEIKPQGFDERFYRMWLYYLHYCEAGFKSGRINVSQFALARR